MRIVLYDVAQVDSVGVPEKGREIRVPDKKKNTKLVSYITRIRFLRKRRVPC